MRRRWRYDNVTRHARRRASTGDKVFNALLVFLGFWIAVTILLAVMATGLAVTAVR